MSSILRPASDIARITRTAVTFSEPDASFVFTASITLDVTSAIKMLPARAFNSRLATSLTTLSSKPPADSSTSKNLNQRSSSLNTDPNQPKSTPENTMPPKVKPKHYTIDDRFVIAHVRVWLKLSDTNDDWYRLYQDVTGDFTREMKTVREDIQFYKRPSRSKMYREQILKNKRLYTPEEREVHDRTLRAVIDAAERLRIELLNVDREQAQYVEEEDDDAQEEEDEAEQEEGEDDDDSGQEDAKQIIPSTEAVVPEKKRKVLNKKNDRDMSEDCNDDTAPSSPEVRVPQRKKRKVDDKKTSVTKSERGMMTAATSPPAALPKRKKRKAEDDDKENHDVPQQDVNATAPAIAKLRKTAPLQSLLRDDAASHADSVTPLVRKLSITVPTPVQKNPTARDLSSKKAQSKFPAETGVETPATAIATAQESLMSSEEEELTYQNFQFGSLNRILLGPANDRHPDRTVTPNDRPLTAHERVMNFFRDMYDGELSDEYMSPIIAASLAGERTPELLARIYNIFRKEGKKTSIEPRYTFAEVFTPGKGPFSNFQLAVDAVKCDLQMLHTNDLDYTSVANGQLALFAKLHGRHLNEADVDFIDHEDPVFKRGGRVHTVYIRQQDCPILGTNSRWNTAYVCIDVMLCQADVCEQCAGVTDDNPHVSISSLPRVHMRHIKGDSQFSAPAETTSWKFDKDEEGKFHVDMNYGVLNVKFWNGKKQSVVVCDRAECLGCREVISGKLT